MRATTQTFLAFLAPVLCAPDLASASAISSSSACGLLKAAVAQSQSPRHGINEYRCELEADEGNGRYFVFALRTNYPAPPGAGPNWVGSSLVGWFAVSRSTGMVFNWDVSALALGQKL